MGDTNAAPLPNDFTIEVGSSPETVAAVRAEMPVGVAGVPIDRIPYNPGLAAMANAGTYTKRIASTDRCIRVIDVPTRGGGVVQCHCSRACVSIGDMRVCPDHDKAAFQPTQTPHGTVGRTLNSASIPLTKSEKDEVSKSSKSFAEYGEGGPPPIQRTEISPAPASSAGSLNPPVALDKKTYPEPQHDLKIYLTLAELAGGDLLEVLRDRIVEALDGLPCGNVRQMKQIVALQDKVAALGGRAKHGRRTQTEPS